LVEHDGNEKSGKTGETTDKKKFFAELGVFFVTILLLWLVFSFVRSLIPLGLFEFILLFPVSYLVFFGLEYVVNRLVQKKASTTGQFLNDMFAGGIFSGAGLFVTLNIANGIVEAAVLSMGFTFGIVLATLIVAEIRRRSEMEAVPRFLRGSPLALVAMGLLSLVFSSAAMMFFDVLTAS
jgi:electron transport complex protein RnfA